jgi:Trypsin-co-occurring domain 1
MAKSKAPKKSEGDLQIWAPAKNTFAVGPRRTDPSVTTHAIQPWTVEEFFDVDSKQMAADWKDKLDRIVDIATHAAQTQQKAWHIDEIEIGLTLSAKGELLFIAEAGAEASVKVTLKKS